MLNLQDIQTLELWSIVGGHAIQYSTLENLLRENCFLETGQVLSTLPYGARLSPQRREVNGDGHCQDLAGPG